MHYVYLLHFDAPLEHNQHYIGSAIDLARRLGPARERARCAS